MPYFRVHYFNELGNRSKYDVEALDRDDAVKDALAWRGLPHNVNCKLIRVTALGREQSHKQKLAGIYRHTIGSILAAKSHLRTVAIDPAHLKDFNKIDKVIRNKQQAIQNLDKALRDVRDLFICLGLRIK